jgi:hypothetical protein
MHVVAQGPVQITEGAKVTFLIIAIGIIAFWRELLRILLAVIAVVIVLAVGAGALTLMRLM